MKILKSCPKCGKENVVSYNGLCQGCYVYFRKGGKIHPLPPKGVVAYSDDGNVICHICGRAYRRLGSHIKESHNMTIKEYKEQFGLCSGTKTTSSEYSKLMSEKAIKWHMDEQLIRTGVNTRFKKGDKTRQGKPVRLQEIIDKRNRKECKHS